MSKYNELMNQVVVTDEMKSRVLANLDSSTLEEKPHIMPWHSYKKYVAIAASLVVLLVSAIAVPRILGMVHSHKPIVLSPTNGNTKLDTASQLSQAVGFSITDIASLPFEVKQTTYTSYLGELAEISYVGENQALTYRKSLGKEDNSGDYNVYTETRVASIDSKTITLKGNDGNYSLVVWTDGQYSYSLRADTGISEDELLGLINGIN